MTRLETLINEATSLGIIVDDSILTSESRLDGLYLHWGKEELYVILINKYRSQCVQCSVMAEELGHYHTCVGSAIDQFEIASVKKEQAGRKMAYQILLPANKLRAALCSGSCCLWELSDLFNLPEEFIQDAFSYYRQRGDLSFPAIECHWCYAV